jgi:hypothetical protein
MQNLTGETTIGPQRIIRTNCQQTDGKPIVALEESDVQGRH